MVEVHHILGEESLRKAFLIREKVFIEEQDVSREDEFDGYDDQSSHYIALFDEVPVGTARWRSTEEGIKLERFAVLPEYRSKGIGRALMERIMQDVMAIPTTERSSIYVHAQESAVYLYEKFDFVKEGPRFEECGIGHFKMVWQNQ